MFLAALAGFGLAGALPAFRQVQRGANVGHEGLTHFHALDALVQSFQQVFDPRESFVFVVPDDGHGEIISPSGIPRLPITDGRVLDLLGTEAAGA